MIKFKNLYDEVAKELIEWIEYVNSEYSLEIPFRSEVTSESTNDIFMGKGNLKIEIEDDYITIELKKHCTEYFSLYFMDFETFELR